MIIFFNRKTGRIAGTIDGRIHTEAHLKMWIGSREENDRIIVNWKPIKDYKNKGGQVIAQDFEPEHEQSELFVKFEKRELKLKDYKVDLETKLLIKK